MDEEIEYQEYEEQKMSRAAIIVRRVFSITWKVLVFAIIALVLWRVLWSDRVPNDMRALVPNDALSAAYDQHGDRLEILTQNFDPVNMDEYRDDINNDETVIAGYFWVLEAVYIPEAKQVQILVRYNNSALEGLAKDFKLDSIPSREETVIDVSLRITTDPNPDNDTRDDCTVLRVSPSAAPTADQTLLYNYRRYIFDNVELDLESSTELTIDFYYIDAVDYDRLPYSQLVVFDTAKEPVDIGLSSRDQKVLEQYRKD